MAWWCKKPQWLSDWNPLDSDSNSDSSFFLFFWEENEKSEKTENGKINFDADSSLDWPVNEYSSSDTETDSESSDDETDNNVNMQVPDW